MYEDDAGEKIQPTDGEGYRRRAVESGAHWCAATLLQIERVVEVGRVLIEQARARPYAESGWDEDAYRAPWIQLEADRHFLLVAAYNLVRAVDFLQYPAHVDTERLNAIRGLSAPVKILRDCNEHWNEEIREWVRKPSNLTGKAFEQLAQLGPEADIRGHRWTASGSGTVAGVLALDELRAAAQEAQSFYADLSSGWYVWDDWPPPKPAAG